MTRNEGHMKRAKKKKTKPKRQPTRSDHPFNSFVERVGSPCVRTDKTAGLSSWISKIPVEMMRSGMQQHSGTLAEANVAITTQIRMGWLLY